MAGCSLTKHNIYVHSARAVVANILTEEETRGTDSGKICTIHNTVLMAGENCVLAADKRGGASQITFMAVTHSTV